MFERFTERARRAIFFARYEASEFGSTAIEPEHLLLGLMRQSKGLSERLFAGANLSYADALAAIRAEVPVREKTSTSVEIPFTEPVKRILFRTREEADRLLHNSIGTEHLLIAIAGEPGTIAASILAAHGLHADLIREEVISLLKATPPGDESDVAPTGWSETVAAISPEVLESYQTRVLTEHVDRIAEQLQLLTAELEGNARALEILEGLHLELLSLRESLGDG